MNFDIIPEDLLVHTVEQMIRGRDTWSPPTPLRLAELKAFTDTPFYAKHGQYWRDFVVLRDKVNLALSQPHNVKFSESEVSFVLASNELNEFTLAILMVYLKLNYWTFVSLHYSGLTTIRRTGIVSASTANYIITLSNG